MMTGSFEHVNELQDFIKYRIFLDHLKKFHISVQGAAS